jgi:hypothetical protein
VFDVLLIIFVERSRISILLIHKSLSSLKGSSLDVIGCLREQVAQGKQNLLADAHEDDIWHWLIGFVLFVLWAVEQSLENNIGLQIVQDLVVTEVAIFG